MLTVEANEECGGLVGRHSRLPVTGSDELDHVTDRLVDVALALSTVRAERHVAPASIAVDQVPGARRRRPPSVARGRRGGEVGDGDVEALSGLGVDDPRLGGRAARRAGPRARYVRRAATAADRHRAATLGVRHYNVVMATASPVTSPHHCARNCNLILHNKIAQIYRKLHFRSPVQPTLITVQLIPRVVCVSVCVTLVYCG